MHLLFKFALECVDDGVLILSDSEHFSLSRKKRKCDTVLSALHAWKILYANKPLLNMLGITTEEEIVHCIEDLNTFVNFVMASQTASSEHCIRVFPKKTGVNHFFVTFNFSVETGVVCATFRRHSARKIEDDKWFSIFDEHSKLLCTMVEYHKDKQDFRLVWNSWTTGKIHQLHSHIEPPNLIGTFTRKEQGLSLEDISSWIDSCEKAEALREPVDVFAEVKMLDNTFKNLKTTTTFVGYNNGYPVFCIIGRDVTELTQTQRALDSRQKELETSINFCKLWKEFFDSAPLPMGVGELVGDSDFRYLHANLECCKLLKLPVEDLHGTLMSQSATTENVQEWISHIREANQSEDRYTEWEMAQHEKDGIAWYHVIGRVKHNLVLFIAKDVSEVKMKEEKERAQKELLEKLVQEKTKDLQEALVVKTRFLGFMSHEIRTPLTGLLGMLTVMQDSVINPSQAEAVRTAKSCGEHLLTIINDILDFTKLGERKVELEKVPFVLRSIIETCMETYATEASKKHVELICDFPSNEEDGFLGDPSRFSQALLNMISNAIKFCDKANGEVVVSVRTAPKALGDEFDALVSIKDNGIGIPDHAKDRLFEPFTQADTSTSRKYGGGTGLGLPICKHIAELMGGKIWFESQEGKGTEFFFSVALKKDPSHIKPHVDLGRISNRTALVIIPNQTLRLVTSRKLSSWGFDVTAEHGCASGLLHLKAGKNFHLVLVDSNLLAEDILELHRMHPVVLMESSLGPSAELKDIPYLKKPLRDAELASVILGKECRAMPAKVDYYVPELHKANILLAEDNVVNQRVIAQLLKKFGNTKLKIANNGEEAFQMASKEKFDIILMDVMMPVMDGPTASKKIRTELSVEQQPPFIVALTADVCPETKVKCIECGMQDLVTKPINMNILQKTLHSCAQKMERKSQTCVSAE